MMYPSGPELSDETIAMAGLADLSLCQLNGWRGDALSPYQLRIMKSVNPYNCLFPPLVPF